MSHVSHEECPWPLKKPRKRVRKPPPWPQELQGLAQVLHFGASQQVGAGAGAGQGAGHGSAFLHVLHGNRLKFSLKRHEWPQVGPHESQVAQAGAGVLQVLHEAAAGWLPSSALVRTTKARFTKVPPNMANRSDRPREGKSRSRAGDSPGSKSAGPAPSAGQDEFPYSEVEIDRLEPKHQRQKEFLK